MSHLLDELRTLLGPAQVLTRTDHGDLSAWERDWRKRWHGQALAVVRPGSTAEVAQVVRACAAQGVSVVPQGGNTGLVVGSVPDDTGTAIARSPLIHPSRPVDTVALLGSVLVAHPAGTCRQKGGAAISSSGMVIAAGRQSDITC